MISMTESAAHRLDDLAREQALDAGGVRVSVRGGGCSGLSYVLDFESQPRTGDKIFESQGKTIYVDLKSFLFLNGTMMDYDGGLNGKGFVFQNPNARASCGCGTSFAA